jgi:beta-lactam-binding protein with PASTA domain
VAGLVTIGVLRSNTVDVPDLRGMTVAEAARALDQVGLELGKIAYTSDIPAGVLEGQIIGQDPTAGEEVEKGSAVSVVVAGESEEETVEIPDVVGLMVEDATKRLTEVGLTVKAVDVEAGVDAGTVVDQSPIAGSTVDTGTEVTLMVSAGMAETLVPNVVGMAQDEATATLEEAGYEVQAKSTFDEEAAEGIVIGQDPQGGVVAEPGTVVDIVVSAGKNPEVAVPDVVGMSEKDAADALDDAGLQAVPSSAYSETAPVGEVIGQDPAAGTTVLTGTAVSITVSEGPKPAETATVPDVIGKTEAEATAILEDAGYVVAVARHYSDSVPADVVGAQAPVGGNITAPGTTVGILVSDGPRPADQFVVIPDLRGLTLEEATDALEELGLEAAVFEVYTSLAPEGQVFAQLPPPGSNVAPGSPVLVAISKGPYPQVNPL